MSEMAVGNIPEVTYVNDWILIKESNGNLKTTMIIIYAPESTAIEQFE